MHRTLLFPLIVLFLASAIPSNAQSEAPLIETEPKLPEGSAGVYPALFYDVGRNLSLKCDVSGDATEAFVWSKNGTNIDQLAEVKARFDVDETGGVLTAKGRAQEEDFGNFTCERGGFKQGWYVRGKPHLKLPQNTNVVEEQKIKMQCKVIGKPYPAQVTWTYRNGTANGNSTSFEVVTGDRITLQAGEQNIQGAELVIEKAQRSDAGEYTCQVLTDDNNAVNATTTLRVKDMYAALWPFLGICAEVFILCAIILVYEKRRTKPEMDDSDTDNHDQ